MGQNEVLNWLIMQRIKDEEEYFTIKEIWKGLGSDRANEKSTARSINRLYAWGYLEISLGWNARSGHFERKFRVMKKYLKNGIHNSE